MLYASIFGRSSTNDWYLLVHNLHNGGTPLPCRGEDVLEFVQRLGYATACRPPTTHCSLTRIAASSVSGFPKASIRNPSSSPHTWSKVCQLVSWQLCLETVKRSFGSTIRSGFQNDRQPWKRLFGPPGSLFPRQMHGRLRKHNQNNCINIDDLWRERVEVESTTRSAKERVAGFEGREGHRTPFAPKVRIPSKHGTYWARNTSCQMHPHLVH
jgi:hypothetical protein